MFTELDFIQVKHKTYSFYEGVGFDTDFGNLRQIFEKINPAQFGLVVRRQLDLSISFGLSVKKQFDISLIYQ